MNARGCCWSEQPRRRWISFRRHLIFSISSPPQITLEARFIEMPTDAARKLELNLPQPTTTTNTWTRVLTASQMKALLRSGMKQRDTVILAAPKVTTLDRRETQITAVEIKTILDSIKQEALTPPGVQSTNGIQAQPFVTSQLSLGPTLDVVPSVAPDNSTI